MDIRFYHLERSKLEQALPGILGIAHKRGMRAVVKCMDSAQCHHLDEHLWSFDPHSFLPHGLATEKNAGQNPIILTDTDINPNDANLMICVGSTDCPTHDKFDMCCHIFDGLDEDALNAARAKWREYSDKGFDLKYFQQNEQGKWQEK